MQIPLRTQSSAEAYISNREWCDARLPACPLHPSGGCSFARHGSYARVAPQGLRIARWYCPQGRCTFSLLPDFLCARLPGLLDAVDQSVRVAVAGAKSMEAAADALRGFDVTLPSAVRWLQRRVRAVGTVLDAVSRLVPPTPMVSVDMALGPQDPAQEHLLLRLRRSLSPQLLSSLPAPLGFQSLPRAGRYAGGSHQHDMGPDGRLAAGYGTAANITEAPRQPCQSIQSSQAPRPPPKTCCVCGAPTTVSRSKARRCTCSGSGASAPIARSSRSMNVPS